MTNYALARKGIFASVFLSLITLIASTVPLQAAITSTGNVEPSGTWTTSTVGYIGNSADGTLVVDAGSVLPTFNSYIAYNSGVTGTATITGIGSKWTDSNSLYVGYNGFGTLSIEVGGQVSNTFGYLGYNSGSTGTATVSGVGSKWTNGGDLSVGTSGSGTLSIEAGGQVSNSVGYLGDNSGSTGTATVIGAGSKWTNRSDLRVGDSGSGTLTIAAGGQVSNSIGYLGWYYNSTGTAAVIGAGSKWTNSSGLSVGTSGSGNLLIEAGGEVSSYKGLLGNDHGSTGSATVRGAGSNWANSSGLYIGNLGSGTLKIEAGGQVSSSGGYLGTSFDARGTVTVTGVGSKWTNANDLYVGRNGRGTLTVTDGGVVTTGTLWASFSDLIGNGVINTKGAVLDTDFVFDNTHGLQVTVPFGSDGTINMTLDGTGTLGAGFKGTGSIRVADGITVATSSGFLGYHSGSTGTAAVTGAGSKWTNGSYLSVGYNGSGALTISAGGQVSNKLDGYLGYTTPSTGTVTVTGVGSKWTNSGYLFVGDAGHGVITIEAGGQVIINNYVHLGFESGSTGTVTVTGAGSKWTNSSSLSLGRSGGGFLHIRDGGLVTANSVSINSKSLLSIDAGYGSVLSVNNGTGSISNDGKVRFVTGPQPRDGSQYSPIAGLWSGPYQAVGGTWDTTSNVFTVSQVLNGVSGTPVGVDLAQQQRVLIGESSLNRTVGASFLAMTGTDKTFNLTAIALADVPALGGLLQPWESVFNAWTFTAEGAGYRATDPVYLSFSVPANMSRDKVRLWKLTGDTWSAFSADDLTVTGGYASFTSTGLSGYAVTVPEPAAVVLVFTAIMGGLFVWRRRR